MMIGVCVCVVVDRTRMMKIRRPVPKISAENGTRFENTSENEKAKTHAHANANAHTHTRTHNPCMHAHMCMICERHLSVDFAR